jgi:hypothetical protein
MSLLFYMLDEKKNVVATEDVHEWARYMGDNETNRHVARTDVGKLHVSTVFLAIEHCSNSIHDNSGGNYLFETMVFGPDKDIEELSKILGENHQSIFSKLFGGQDVQVRYKTWQEAEEGHKKMAKAVERLVASRN